MEGKKTHKILPDWVSVVKETELGQLCKSAGQRAGTSTAVIVVVVKGSARGALRGKKGWKSLAEHWSDEIERKPGDRVGGSE